MGDLSSTAILNSIVYLLTEAYAGPPDPSSTWFIDNEPDSGVLGIIANVSAAEASKSVDGSGEAGTTIAANVEHLRWSLSMMNAAVRGETFEGKWKESWRLLTVDDASWDALRNELRVEFEMLRQGLQSQTDLPEQYLTGTLALLPHAAYHLGTIRQMIERVRA
jgi:hypothetical protein